MPYRRLLVLIAAAGASCLASAPALAATKCFCNNGVIVQSMTDDGDDDDCNDACDDMGGGRLWTPADSPPVAESSDTYVGSPDAVDAVRAEEARGGERVR